MRTGESILRRASFLRLRVARDLAADWKRWTLTERIVAVAMVPAVVLMVLAMSKAIAWGGP